MLKYFLFVQVLVSTILGSPPGSISLIVSGNETSIEDHPYIVSVQDFGRHICGGTIISPSFIVSAAHCFNPWKIFQQLHKYSIRAGSTFHDEGGEVIFAKNIIIHESYDMSNADYDIALIQLRNNITTPSARPIEFADEGESPADGTIGTLTGWGAIFHNDPLFHRLKSIDVEVIGMEKCRGVYDWFRLSITDRMFCAGNLVGTGVPCRDDSAGPLVVNGVLTGIISKGGTCWLPTAPEIFTSIPRVSLWIKKKAGI